MTYKCFCGRDATVLTKTVVDNSEVIEEFCELHFGNWLALECNDEQEYTLSFRGCSSDLEELATNRMNALDN